VLLPVELELLLLLPLVPQQVLKFKKEILKKEKFKNYLEIKQSQKKLLDVMTLELVGFVLPLVNLLQGLILI
jgi:hypothetical protein